MTTLRPFFSYFGSKWRIAPKYPPPEHNTIIEPFAGNAGYSVRYADRKVTLIDKDEIVIGTWQYLISVSGDEIRTLPLLKPGQSVDDFNLTQEQRWLIGFWANKSQTSPCKIQSLWTASNPGSHWGASVRERLASSVDAIRHWHVIHGDYTDALDIEATWFIDPPYTTVARQYRHGVKGIDYGHLGSWVRSRIGQTIVCESADADWLPFESFTAARGVPRRGESVSAEVVYYGQRT